MRQLYYSHVYPHLIGAITIWGSANKNKAYLQPLIRTQKKIIRIVKNVRPNTHTQPIMKELSILNLTHLYVLRVCLEMHPFIYKQKQKNRPDHDHDYISTTEIHEYPTRHSKQQHFYIPNKPTTKTNHKMDLFTRCFTEIWNSLPLKLRGDQSYYRFKRNLKVHLLEKQDTEC